MYYRFCVCKDKTNIRTLQIILRMFPPHTAYRTIYQPQKIFYYFSKVSPTLIFPQISYHPEQGRMKTHTPSADPIRNTHRHSQSADIGYDNLRQVADFPFRTAPDGFFAKRAGRDDHLGTGSFQLPGHGFCDLHLLTVGDRRIGDRRAAAGGVSAGSSNSPTAPITARGSS